MTGKCHYIDALFGGGGGQGQGGGQESQGDDEELHCWLVVVLLPCETDDIFSKSPGFYTAISTNSPDNVTFKRVGMKIPR